MQISLIVAVAANGVIGRNGDLPWRLSADLRRFRRLTTGHFVIMGRKTYESIVQRLGKPLPKRTSIVLTRQTDFIAPEGVLVANDWSAAIQLCQNQEQVFVIGGEQIYRLALPHAHRVLLTQVETSVDGDAYFPELNAADWREIDSESCPADEKNEAPSRFITLERLGSTPNAADFDSLNTSSQ